MKYCFFLNYGYYNSKSTKKSSTFRLLAPPNLKALKSTSGLLYEFSVGLYNNMFVTPNS